MDFRICMGCGASRIALNVKADNTAQALMFALKLAQHLAPSTTGENFRLTVKPRLNLSSPKEFL